MKRWGMIFDMGFRYDGNKTPSKPAVFCKNLPSEDYSLGQEKLCPFSSMLVAKLPFFTKNGGRTMGKTEKRAIVVEGGAENDKR